MIKDIEVEIREVREVREAWIEATGHDIFLCSECIITKESKEVKRDPYFEIIGDSNC